MAREVLAPHGGVGLAVLDVDDLDERRLGLLFASEDVDEQAGDDEEQDEPDDERGDDGDPRAAARRLGLLGHLSHRTSSERSITVCQH